LIAGINIERGVERQCHRDASNEIARALHSSRRRIKSPGFVHPKMTALDLIGTSSICLHR
jgi:hypothetical protein